MLKACRGFMLATGVLSYSLVAQAECPPEDSIDRYTQTAGDALTALHELVPESQQRALADRYAAMVMLKWQWQGRDAVLAVEKETQQLRQCYETASCGIRASSAITVQINASLEDVESEPIALDSLLPEMPSPLSVAWARRTLSCDRPQPAPVLADLIEPAPDAAPPETTAPPQIADEVAEETNDISSELASVVSQFSSSLRQISFDPAPAEPTLLDPEQAERLPVETAPTDTTVVETVAPEAVDPNIIIVEPEPTDDPSSLDQSGPSIVADIDPNSNSQDLMLSATNLVFAGQPGAAIEPLETACLLEAQTVTKSAPCETLFSVYTNALVASEYSNSSEAYLDLSQRLCSIGYSRGCDNLSRYYAAQNSPDAHRSAVAYAEQSCNLNNAEACATVSNFYLSGRASEPDPSAARAKLEQSCELGRLLSCQEVADFYLRGVGGEPDAVMALRMVEASCPATSAERADLCVSAADYILIHEQAGQARSARVRTFIKRACEIGHDVGCAWYAEDLELGIGGDVDLPAARQARLTACEYGDQKSCNSRS